MQYLEFTKTLLYDYHKDIRYVFTIVGEIYHNSNGLTNTFMRKSMLNGELYDLGFNSDSKTWIIEKR